ncbi:peptidylprolyl isomerase [Catenovulum sp. SM1970]|uniref:peptidylprolyl isomerase n=1 Tax=Marinifaba aquimaris TaxID=2741323 RepID=UPI0015741F8B|nr:peptidylprolyl isomerase [Marinifaba aquimaris]NTS76432.1 peptidylprolyl isomerase [Marinifaba aquimaris]
MKIANNTVVSMHYLVKDSEGVDIDSSFDGAPLEFIQGTRFLISGLEDKLVGHEAGDKFSVAVSAEDGYGLRHDTLVQEVPKTLFEGIEEVYVGMQLRAGTDEGEQTVIVVDVTDETVTVDGNHPLAGVNLEFDVEIVAVRQATEEEIAHGHVHGEGGCGSQAEAAEDDCCGDSNCSSTKH